MSNTNMNDKSYEKLLYSKILDRVYKEDEEDKLLADELAYKQEQEAKEQKKLERKNRAEEINLARESAEKAIEHYNELINKFVEDYGSYHYTTSKPIPDNRTTLFNRIWGLTDLFDFMRL